MCQCQIVLYYEDTSLQKLLKQQLLKNKEMKIGWGKLKI